MYDRQSSGTESLVSQMMAKGVTGPLANMPLRRLPLEVTTWESWRSRYPESQVMSIDTGHQRKYDRTVYASYFASPKLVRPVTPTDERLPAKTSVLGVAAGDVVRAYPIEEFLSSDDDKLEQQLGGKSFALTADRPGKTLRIQSADDGVEWVYSYWFAWYAMNPTTELWDSTATNAN
jgi:hypothetical protein